MIFPEKYEHLFPLACHWVAEQERLILAKGVPLTTDQKIDAYLIGIEQIEKIRLLKVDTIPIPNNQELLTAMKAGGFLSAKTIGTAFRYGIYIQTDYWDNRRLLIHELTHTMQYERFKGIEPFLYQYLLECLTIGYPNGPLEQEAIRFEQEIGQR